MFILRTINKKSGIASNQEIGERYTLTFGGTEDFEKIKIGSYWESSCEDHNMIGAFLSNHDGRIEALSSYNEYYIMTESGKTFEKIFI